MSDTKGKVNLLDTVPVQCGHITTEWEGEYAILSFPRFKYDWMRRFLLPKSMSADIHVKLEEHGTAVWRLIDGNRAHETRGKLVCRLLLEKKKQSAIPISYGCTQ